MFRRASDSRSGNFEEIVRQLNDGKPTLVLMMLSDAFYWPDAEGFVAAPADERPDPSRRHAVVAVGHGIIAGERAILVRNSWGIDWGLAGHAWLPETFIGPRITHVVLLTEEVHVPA